MDCSYETLEVTNPLPLPCPHEGTSGLESYHPTFGLILPNINKWRPYPVVMELISILETAAITMCGVATILWMAIGTLARFEKGEIMTQKIVATLCIISAIMLFLLHYLGGELWGSTNVARPFALVAIIVAISGMMNIKGKDVQGETNPHQIMKMRAAERKENKK